MSALTSASDEDFAHVWGQIVASLPGWADRLGRELRDVHLARQGIPTKRKALSENAIKALTALYQEYGGVSARADGKSPALA